MNSKTLRIAIGVIWFIVAIVLFTRNQMGSGLLTAAIGLIFVVMGFRAEDSNTINR